MTRPIKQHLLVMRNGLTLLALGLIALLFPLLLRSQLRAGQALLSPLPAGLPPCASVNGGDFLLTGLGYVRHADGTTTLSFALRANSKYAISHLAFGTNEWSRREPGDGATYGGGLGAYRIVWTNGNGQPGFTSIKYEPLFAGYSQGASDTFALRVAGFDPAAWIPVQVKAGKSAVVTNLTLSDPACDRTPLPAPTPTPASPLLPPTPTATPNPSLTLDDYAFSAPQIVLTHTSNLEVFDWLPDSQWALVKFWVNNRGIKFFNPETGELRPSGQGIPGYRAVWLAATQKLAYTDYSIENQTGLSYLSLDGQPARTMATGGLGWRIAGHNDRVLILPPRVEAPMLFDGEGNTVSLPPINLHDYGINDPGVGFGTTLRWHPTEHKALIADEGGFVVVNFDTGVVKAYNLTIPKLPGAPDWAADAQWSPDGSSIAIAHVGESYPFPIMRLGILDVATGQLRLVSVPMSHIYDFAWAPNSRQLLVAGSDKPLSPSPLKTIFLVDTLLGDSREITQFTNRFVPSANDGALAWSPNGQSVLFRCLPPELTTAPIALCASTVTIGGAQ